MNNDELTADMLFATEDQQLAAEADESEVINKRQVLTFFIDTLRFGVETEYVVEIITNKDITYLPRLPEYILGVMNLRGTILPIVDLRVRLGKPVTDDSLIIVLQIGVTQFGIMIDAIDQILEIPEESILPVPSGNNQPLVSGICTMPDGSGTLLMLACDELMPNE